jgi:hypothetical protein
MDALNPIARNTRRYPHLRGRASLANDLIIGAREVAQNRYKGKDFKKVLQVDGEAERAKGCCRARRRSIICIYCEISNKLKQSGN